MKKAISAVLGCTTVMLGTTAHAQDGESRASASAALEEIVVTARRVGENLQDVPIAITALTSEDLRKSDVRTAYDLQRLAPSLNVTGGLGRNSESYALRGQRETKGFTGAGGGPAVVPYFAEVPTIGQGPGNFFDLQSVQVLRGPQGTLFGRNTTGGAILFEPARPTNELGGYVEAGFGNYQRFDIEGVLNVPLIDDKLLLRVGVQRQSRDGFTRDVSKKIDYDNRDNLTARASLLFKANEAFENLTILNYGKYDENGVGQVLLAVNPVAGFAPLLTPLLGEQKARGIRSTALSAQSKEKGQLLTLVNRTQLKLSSSIELNNIISYARTKRDNARDDDGTFLPIQDSNGAVDLGTWNQDSSLLTEELRLSGNSGGFLDWQIGGYLERYRTEGPQTYSQVLNMFVITHQLDARFQTDSDALYGQATLDMGALVPSLKGLNLTGGYRHTSDTNGALSFEIVAYLGPLLPGTSPSPPLVVQPGDLCLFGGAYPPCRIGAKAPKNSGDSWIIGADYKIGSDALVYANLRRGYKSGGFNPTVAVAGGTPSTPGFQFEPEQVDTAELGIKAGWTIGGMNGRTNVALFQSKYDNMQVSQNVIFGDAYTEVVQNAAKSTIRGIEIEGELRPIKPLLLTFGYSYLDAGYNKFAYVNPTGDLVDLTQLPFLYTPSNKIDLVAQLSLPVPESVGEVSLSANYSWQDDVYVGNIDRTVPFSTIPSYGLLGARVDWNGMLGFPNLDAALFVTNLTNKDYRLGTSDGYNTAGFISGFYGEPRMYGASMRYRF